MLRYAVNRILWGIVAIIGVSIIVFVATRVSGDVVDLLLPPERTEQDMIDLRKTLGLDKPIFVQYFIFAGNALRGDFGESYRYHRPAMDMVLARMPATLQLTGAALIISVVIAVPVGVFAARRPGGLVDTFAKGFAMLGQAMPAFWVGLLLMWLFAVVWRVLPSGGIGTIRHLILPAVTLGWFSVAALLRLTRSAMLDVLNSDYIVVARAKGAPESIILWKHALRNALIPVVTLFGLQVARLFGGTVIIETIFSWPGVGRLLVSAVFDRDYQVVQAAVFMMSLAFVVTNLLVDLSYAVINPRIRYQ